MNDILSHEQPQKKLTGQNGRKEGGKRRGETLDSAESVFRSEEEVAKFLQSMQIVFGNRKEFRRKT